MPPTGHRLAEGAGQRWSPPAACLPRLPTPSGGGGSPPDVNSPGLQLRQWASWELRILGSTSTIPIISCSHCKALRRSHPQSSPPAVLSRKETGDMGASNGGGIPFFLKLLPATRRSKMKEYSYLKNIFFSILPLYGVSYPNLPPTLTPTSGSQTTDCFKCTIFF